MPEIILADRHFFYQVKRKARSNNINMKLVTPTTIEISVPKTVETAELQKLLHKNQKWILKRSEQLNLLAANPVNTSLNHGSQVLYQGRPYFLHIHPSDTKHPAIFLHPGRIHLSIPVAKMNDSSLLAYDMLRRWYIENATHHFTEKTTFWAGRIAVQPAKISIRDQKTRWGSCSSRGNINFNWRIVMAPPEIMDYLVIHELCHMRIPNHSSLYWQLVEQFMPEYRQRRDWLKHNSRLLTRIL